MRIQRKCDQPSESGSCQNRNQPEHLQVRSFLFFRFQLGAKRTQWLGQNIHDSRGGEYKAKININVMQIVW